MRVLALDTTTRGGSFALVEDGRVVAERRGDASRSHAELLPGELMLLLEASGVAVRDVDLFAVATGPGSFTGLRIGIATMQGLALTMNRPLAGVSALEALGQAALELNPAAPIVGSWIDAQRGEVFTSLYEAGAGAPFSVSRTIAIDEAAVGQPHHILERWRRLVDLPDVLFVGSGAVRYAEDVRAATAGRAAVAAAPPLASAIGLMAHARPDLGRAPAAIRPLYVRRSDAELARDRASGTHATTE